MINKDTKMDLLSMQNEVFTWAHTKGWEPDPDRPFADACALLHSEVSEALEAYRTWKFDDATLEAIELDENGYRPGGPPKPEGVASELADVLIRLLHYCKCYGLSIHWQTPLPEFDSPITFGTECALMHAVISGAFLSWECRASEAVNMYISELYALLQYSCQVHGFDLQVEYRRKMDYNVTRSHRHGNREM